MTRKEDIISFIWHRLLMAAAEYKKPIRLNLIHVEQLDDLIWAKYTIKK